MKLARYAIAREDAPPGFWPSSIEETMYVEGVELESAIPTRFFQSVDPYPPDWGRLLWRVQLNKIAGDRAATPVFRTFYPGVEWNLAYPDYRWFLTAWITWQGPGPDARVPQAIEIENDTVLFRVASFAGRPLFIRSRVDARDRRSIAAALRAEQAAPQPSDPDVIVLDDVIERHG